MGTKNVSRMVGRPEAAAARAAGAAEAAVAAAAAIAAGAEKGFSVFLVDSRNLLYLFFLLLLRKNAWRRKDIKILSFFFFLLYLFTTRQRTGTHTRTDRRTDKLRTD